jgi:hypothetical protein
LQHEISVLSEFPNMILYTSQGMDFALHAQKALASFAGPGKFLTAYLKFNSKGEAVSSRLLMDDDALNIALEDKVQKVDEASVTEAAIPKALDEIAQLEQEVKIPLTIEQISDLAKKREQSLRPLSLKLIILLRKQTSGFVENFSHQMMTLLEKYNQIDSEFYAKIKAALIELKKKYDTLEDYAYALHSAGLLAFVDDETKAAATSDTDPSLLFNQQVENLNAAHDMNELDSQVTQIAILISKQNERAHLEDTLKTKTLTRLTQLLNPTNERAPRKTDRKALIHLLRKVGLTTQEEQAIYLDLFDKLQEKNLGK